MRIAPVRSHRPPASLVTVILPVRNAVGVIEAQLDALERQTYDGDWELMVVDDGSSDGTWELVSRRLAGRPGARALRVSHGRRNGASAARNFGASLARGELLTFCDADDVVAPDWLRQVALTAQRADLVAPRFEVCSLNRESVRQWHGTPPSPRPHPLSRFLPAASSAGCAVWAEVFAVLNGFDEDHPGAEDKDFSWRLQLLGYRLEFVARTTVAYRYRSTMRQTARQEFRWGMADARLFRDYRRLGMRRTPLIYALGSWGRTLLGIPFLPWVSWQRGRWTVRAARLTGRVAGSLRERVFFP